MTLPLIEHHMANIDNGADHLPNSLEALQASLAANAAIIEIDVQVLKADDYVLLHDATLDRETTPAGASQPAPWRISNLSSASTAI